MAKVQNIDPQTFEIQQYSDGDQTTIPSLDIDSLFSLANGRVESLIYDLGGNLIDYNPNAKYSVVENELGAGPEFASTMFVYPEKEVTGLGYEEGNFNVVYNFLNNELNSSFDQRFLIKEISANRKELRLVTNTLTEEELKTLVNKFFPEVIITPEYPDFYINLGLGRLYIANNCLFDNTNGQYSVLIKLYEALPVSVQEKDTLWIVTEQKNTVAYNVEFEQEPFVVKDTIDLKGPNFSLSVNNNTHTSVELKSLDDLSSPSGLTTSSYNQLQSILQEKGVEINIDYTKFDNFIHFSSAEERIKNFYSKVVLIETASNQISDHATGSVLGPLAGSFISSSKAKLEKDITNIIENFDGFEYYLYYSSGSFGVNDYPQPFPKTNSTPPYSLANTVSIESSNWLISASYSGSLHDELNSDNLTKTIPDYILEDPDNEPYKKFVEMTGQHFDTLFTYAQDITNKYNADNRLNFGISKDLVGEAIKSMGVNLHTGNFNSTDLISSYIGISGSNYQLPLPDGQSPQLITDYITASNDPTPIEDVNNQIYKRIYHNLPLLLKQKGSVAGLRTLITTFGIPERVFPIREYSITGKPTIQSLPTASVNISSSINFPTSSIPLPTSSSLYKTPPPELLSPLIRVQQDFVKSESYDRSLHYVEAGFSPSNDIDDALSASSYSVYKKLTEDPGQYIGDFDNFYFGEGNTYSGLVDTYSSYYGGTPWNTAAFIRYVKFLDSSLFSMIKDFTPVRSSTATGVIIKPTLQQRSVQRPVSMSLQNLTFEGVVNSNRENYTLTKNSSTASIIPIGKRQHFLTSSGYLGGTGGTFEDFNRIKFSSSAAGQDFLNKDLPTPIDNGFNQTWSEEVIGRTGINVSGSGCTRTKVHSDQAEFYNGIFLQTGNSVTRSSVVSNPNGIFQTDNNPQNPYKKALAFTEYGGLTAKGQLTSYLQLLSIIFANPKTVAITPAYGLFYQDYDSLFFNSNFASGDGKIQTVLEGNGTTLTLQHSSGRQYTFQVLSTSIWNGVDDIVEVAVSTQYLQGDRNTLLTTDIASGQTVSFLPNWDPFTSNNAELNPGPFLYSDYNPLINNTSDPGLLLENYEGIRKSLIYQDADYSGAASSSILPINNDLLVSGSASKAAVQDSNYGLASWTNPRYNGTRVSSLDFNRRIIRVAAPEAEIFTTSSVDFNFAASASNPSAPFNPGPGIT